MDFIFENPLARMYGPDFLVLYVAIYAVLLFLIRFILPEKIGNRYKESDPAVPDQPDAYQIAYLRRGEHEVLVLTVFNLIRRKYFSLERPKAVYTLKIRKTDISALTELERKVYHCLEKDTGLASFIKTTLKDDRFLNQCENIKKELEDENLIWTPKDLSDFKRWIDGIISVLVILGTYKMVAAIMHGHANIMGIILVSTLGSYLLSKIKVRVMPTSKGNSLLEKLRSVFKAVHGNKLLEQPSYIEHLLISLYGFEILSQSSYSMFYSYVQEQVNPASHIKYETVYGSNSGSGSSCSSSGCSGGGSGCGSSCGGGCGGCGGCS